MLCLYLTIALCIIGMLPVSLGASFNPGLKREKGLTRLHKREVPVPRAINNVTRAAHTQGEEGKDEASKTHRSLMENWDISSGIAIIEDDSSGALCTGVHLHPKIILTTGDCVFEQLPEDTRVTVAYGKHGRKHDTVNVKDIIVNPSYIPGNKQNNQAVVVAYVKSRRIDVFHIPPDNFTYDDLTLADTYLHDWETFNKRKRMFTSENVEVQVSEDTDVCDDDDYVSKRKTKYVLEEKYCCDREGYPHTSEWYDVGSPLFYVDDDTKYVVGLYAGENEGEEMAGHWAWSIFPDRDWLRQVLEKYSRQRG